MLAPFQADMGISTGSRPSRPSPASLKFLRVESRKTLSPFGIDEWTLHYQLVDTVAPALRLQWVFVQGILPKRLVGLRVFDPLVEVFALKTHHDATGRSCAAGEMMIALYGIETQGELRVPTTEFVRPLQALQARVKLQVIGVASLDIPSIAVLGVVG